MKKATLFVGLLDGQAKTQIFGSVEALDLAQDASLSYFSGATFSLCTGTYQHEDGTKILEETIKIELFNMGDQMGFTDQLNRFCVVLKSIFNQECIGLEMADVNFQYV